LYALDKSMDCGWWVGYCSRELGKEPIGVDVNLVNVGFTAQDGRGALVNSLAKK
jgi:hypothetical protein